MPRPKIHDEHLRAALLRRAGELVSANGIDGLTLRSLAAAEGTSTTAVYALFGGKPELLAALYTEAFRGFGAAQRGAPRTGDPAVDLIALGLAYRDWALANPELYAVMFGGSLAGFDPDLRSTEEAVATMDPLREVVTAAVRQRGLTADPLVLSITIWGLVHGLVSLELTQSCPPLPIGTDELYQQAVQHAVESLLSTGAVEPG